MFINENHFNSPQYRTFLQALVILSGFWCENLYLTNFPGEVLSPCVPQWLNVCSLTESSPANAFWTWRYDRSKQFNVLDLLILHKIFRSRRELWARVITRVNLPRTGIFHIIHFQCKGVLGVSFSATIQHWLLVTVSGFNLHLIRKEDSALKKNTETEEE